MKTAKKPAREIKYSKVAMVARWQPVHIGHLTVLRTMCQQARQVTIGIGSSNVHDLRSPFTLEEVTDMLRLALAGWENFTLVPVPDLNNGPRWREMVLETFGEQDVFLTANPYVRSLLEEDYRVIHPVEMVPEDERIPVTGTMVRRTMARGEDWKSLVPPVIADYLITTQLDERFRREFGLQTLALETIIVERSN